MGMRGDSVKAGDAILITFHPMKDGTMGDNSSRRWLTLSMAIEGANSGEPGLLSTEREGHPYVS
jgi:hypothetical protein